MLHAAPTLTLKVSYPDNTTPEKTIGYASSLTYTVFQGQKEVFVVDSPFPAEISQASGPSLVRGSVTLYMPKGSTPEYAGLVPFRTTSDGKIAHAATKYLNWRLYDRLTGGLVLSLDYVKVSQYTVTVGARTVVTVRLEFAGMYSTPGNAG